MRKQVGLLFIIWIILEKEIECNLLTNDSELVATKEHC